MPISADHPTLITFGETIDEEDYILNGEMIAVDVKHSTSEKHSSGLELERKSSLPLSLCGEASIIYEVASMPQLGRIFLSTAANYPFNSALAIGVRQRQG